MLTPRPLAAAILAGLTMAVAACGGDDGPTKAEFAKQANAACADLEKALNRLGESNPSNAKELETTVENLQKEVDGGINRLQDIEQPSGQAGEDAKAFVDGLSKQVEGEILPAFDDIKKAAREEDQQLLGQAVQKLQGVDSERTDELAKQAGANECAG